MGTVNARGGVGGSGECLTQGGDGGNGIIRFCDISAIPNSGGNAASPAALCATGGNQRVAFIDGTNYVIESYGYDTQNSSPSYTGVDKTQTLNGGTISLEFSASNDNFVNDSTAWVPEAAITTLSGKRYIKFRATLNSGFDSSTPMLDELRIQYEPRLQPEFSVKQLSCGAVHSERTDSGNLIATLGLLLYLFSLPRVLRWIRSSISRPRLR